MKTEPLYDVVIYEDHHKVVTTIVGRRLPLENGTLNAKRRLATIEQRLNDDFRAAIVSTGTAEVGKELGAEVGL